MSQPDRRIERIEVVEDFSSTARCDEGFLQLRRLRCRNRRSDGSSSNVYRVDVIDRPRLDAVAVLVYRHGETGLEVLTRMQLRSAAFFRKDREMAMTIPDGQTHLQVEEIVAGLLEPEDKGEAGLLKRAAAEVKEEAGFEVEPSEVRTLGAPFFVVPGILSEKIFPTAVDVTGKPHSPPKGDGTPLEEGAALRWRPLKALLQACRAGELQDAKTEIAAARLLAELA